MSDFDDLFSKRLDEEASFPNRNKNWKQLSKRLDAFDTGVQQVGKGTLRFWQLATGLSLVAAAFFIWKYQHVAQDNQDLRREREQLEQQVAKQSPIAQTIPDKNAPATISIPPAGPQKIAVQQENHPASLVITEQPKANNTSSKQSRQNNQSSHAQNPVDDAPKSILKESGGNLANNQVVQDKKSAVENQEKLAGGIQQEKAEPKIQNQEANPTGVTAVEPQADKQDETAAAEPPVTKQDEVVATVPPVSKQDSVAVEKTDQNPDAQPLVDQNPLPSSSTPEIKPHQGRGARFRAGVQATVGWAQPRQKGVSALTGQGVSLETKILPGLWATASVDWMQHQINTEEFIPRFHPHHDSLPRPKQDYPGGGPQPHPDKLVEVQSNPRENHFSLGLRYALPVQFWVKPSVQLSHEWVRIAPNLITYKFVDDDPGGPQHHDEDKYTAEKFPAQWLNNQWHLGVGLEKDVPGWTFGAWAEYSKSFAAITPSYDALYLRLKAQYRF